MKRTRGFSLVEIAMVVAIALILLSLGLTAINSQLSSTAYSITKKRQDAIKDALIGYLGARKSFPCPYVPVAGTPATGIAPPQSIAAAPACPQVFGTVPYATLGLAREAAEDGWGNLISYQVYSIPAVCPSPLTDWANSKCFGAGKTGAIVVNDGTVGAPTPLVANAIAVLVSHGANGLGAWVAAQGTRNANPVTCEEAHNGQITTVCAFVANTYYKGESQANDDVVTYLTASDALQPLAKQGTINSAAAQVNLDLQTLYDQAIANNTTTPACTTAPPLFADPWGNAYMDLGASGTILFCFYSTANGTGLAPTAPCICSPPTVCRALDRTTVNIYRNRASATPLVCP
jgi:prepilin-type N-terminal cleavage/methylation domain-containing protein